jgi:hypothetical protein
VLNQKADTAGPTPLSALVGSVRADMARAGGCALDAFTWQRVIGERIASRSRPETLRDGVLTLRVASSVWAQELSLLSATIIERLASAGFVVSNVRCKVAPLPQAKRSGRSPTVTTPPLAAPKVELPAALATQLERIADPCLRELIEATARAQMQLQLRKKAVSATRRQAQTRTAPHRTTIAAKPGVRGPQSAGPGSAPRGQIVPEPSEGLPRTRGHR